MNERATGKPYCNMHKGQSRLMERQYMICFEKREMVITEVLTDVHEFSALCL